MPQMKSHAVRTATAVACRYDYGNSWKFLRARIRRALLRALISPLVKWSPDSRSQAGLTVILACNCRLLPLLHANLLLLAKQDLREVKTIIVVFDETKDGLPAGFLEQLSGRFSALPLRFLFYSRLQKFVASMIDWGWVYSWLSWSIGIAATQTRYAMLHDLDALLLRNNVLAEQYRKICHIGVKFLGTQYYSGHGIQNEDRLVTTFEMVFDASHVRSNYRAIDLFNRVMMFCGRRVEFDTFLYVQSCSGETEIQPIAETSMVHPSQMICQYVDHVNGRRVPTESNNLLLLPYFYYLGGEKNLLFSLLTQLRSGRQVVTLFGRALNPGLLSAAHVDWYLKQVERVEAHLWGTMRKEIKEYVFAIRACRLRQIH
jgi:hypothetical protein